MYLNMYLPIFMPHTGWCEHYCICRPFLICNYNNYFRILRKRDKYKTRKYEKTYLEDENKCWTSNLWVKF